jgi:hypothetical protein
MSYVLDYEAWRCMHDERLFCPDEGCTKHDGCARDRGWQPGEKLGKKSEGAFDRDFIWQGRAAWIGVVVKYKFFAVGMKGDVPRHPIYLGTRDTRDL